jgi:hypothetical protein
MANAETRTTTILHTVSALSTKLYGTWKDHVHFFIKGGAAAALLTGDPLKGDIDTYLLFNPASPAFEEDRKYAIALCLRMLLEIFKPTQLAYGSYETDRTLQDIMAELDLRPFRKEISESSTYAISVYGNLLSKGASDPIPLTLLTLKQVVRTASGWQSTVLLDIIVPKKDYPLIGYHWNSIETVVVNVAGMYVPVMDPVSAYVNQKYAAAKSTSNVNRAKRQTRANAILGQIRKQQIQTRKGRQLANAAKVTTNRDLIESILEELPANNTANKKGIVVANSGGAGAGAGALLSLPPLPPSPPFSPLPSPPLPPSYTEQKVYAPPAGKEVLLRTYTNGMMHEIFDLETGRRLALIEIIPTTKNARYGTNLNRVFINGRRTDFVFDPRTQGFDPVHLTLYFRRR